METANLDGIPEQAIRSQLDLICTSVGFRNSGRLSRFLRYAVNQTLEGAGDALKEYAIGIEVYDRKHSYSPQNDSIVRTEARRLRSKLKEYYEGEGSSDEVLIFFRVGTYKPTFRKHPTQRNNKSVPIQDQQTARSSAQALRTGSAFAVLPLEDLSSTVETTAIAAGMAHELNYRISLTEGCRSISLNSTRHMPASPADLSQVCQQLDIQQIIYGSVQKHGSQIIIMMHGLNPLTHETWTEKFDAEEHDCNPIRLQEYVASALMARVGPRRSGVRSMQERIAPAAVALYPALLSAETLLDHCDQKAIRHALRKFRVLANGPYKAGRVFCGIAQCHYIAALLGQPLSPDDIADCKDAAQRTMEIDDQMSESHAALGCAQALALNFRDAEQSFLRALALGPHLVPMQLYAHLLASMGRFDEALLQLRASHEIDPFSGQQKLACARVRYLSRHFQDDYCDSPFEIEYGQKPCKAILFQAKVKIQLGQTKEAVELADFVLRKAIGQPAVVAEVAQVLGAGGWEERAEMLVEKFGLLDSEAAVSKIDQARLCIALGRSGCFESCLTEAVRRREPQLWELAVDPAFDQVRETQIFAGLMGNLNQDVFGN